MLSLIPWATIAIVALVIVLWVATAVFKQPVYALIALSLLGLVLYVQPWFWSQFFGPRPGATQPSAAPKPQPKVEDLRTDLAASYLLAGFDLAWIRRNIEDPLGGPVPEYVTPIAVTPAPKPAGTNHSLLQAIHDEWTKS